MNTAPEFKVPRGAPASAVPPWSPAIQDPGSSRSSGGHGSEAPTARPWLGPQPKREFDWELARDALEDIGTLRYHRIPDPEESWRAPDRSEQRLLAKLDAAIACGPVVLEMIASRHPEFVSEDPDFLFSTTLFLGCIRSDEARDLCLTLLRKACESGPDSTDAAVEALQLTSNPNLVPPVVSLLGDPDARTRAAAVSVLNFWGEMPSGWLTTLLDDPNVDVVRAAAGASWRINSPDAAAVLVRHLKHADEVIVHGALWALQRRNHPAARARALDLCQEGRLDYGSASLLLGLAGHRSDLDLLARALDEHPSRLVAQGAARFGHVALVEALLRALPVGDKDLQLSIAKALDLITGAGLTEEIEEPVHDPEDLEYLDGVPEPLRRRVLSLDVAAWNEWWRSNSDRFDTKKRYRRGFLLEPRVLVDELSEDSSDSDSRLLTQFELCMLVGDGAPRFDPRDFVADQEQSIQNWVQFLSRHPASRSPGTWRDDVPIFSGHF